MVVCVSGARDLEGDTILEVAKDSLPNNTYLSKVGDWRAVNSYSRDGITR